MQNKTLVVIGGGAAGFFCAVNAARLAPSLTVLLLEKSNKLLAKVRISGGGRCNVTHACFDVNTLVKKYPRGEKFLKKAYYKFSPVNTIQWFNERGVGIKQEADGRMFPDTDDSASIIDCLVHEARQYGVKILLNQGVQELQRVQDRWQVKTGTESFEADFVCVACGGFPKSEMFAWLGKLGHSFSAPVPSLFTFNLPGQAINSLMGVVVPDAQVRIIGSKLSERGPVLVTHWGLSGPAILRLSAWGARELATANWNFEISVNWLPAYNENSLREFLQQVRFEKAAQKMVNRNPFGLAQRFWEFLLEQSGIPPDTRWSDMPAKAQNLLARNCCSAIFPVKGKTTFKEEFVTAGGISLSEIAPAVTNSSLKVVFPFTGKNDL